MNFVSPVAATSHRRATTSIGFLISILLVASGSSFAATQIVNTNGDSGTGSLRVNVPLIVVPSSLSFPS